MPRRPIKILFNQNSYYARDVAFIPNTSQLIAGLWKCNSAIWDFESGQEVARTSGRQNELAESVAVSRDGSMVATTNYDNTVRVWPTVARKRRQRKGGPGKPPELMVIRELQGHTDSVLSADFSADGRRIASTGPDRTVRVWNIEDGSVAFGPIECRDTNGRVEATIVRYSPDGRLLAASIDQIYIWDADTGHRVGTIEITVASMQWTPDSTKLVGGGHGEIIVLDALKGGNRLCSFNLKGNDHKRWVRVLALSPTGSLAIAATRWEKTAIVVDLAGRNAIAKLPHEREVFCAAWSPSGEFVAVVSGREVYLWSAPDPLAQTDDSDEEREFVHADGEPNEALQKSEQLPDPSLKNDISPEADTNTQALETITQPVKILSNTQAVLCAAFFPDSSNLVCGLERDYVCDIWDLASGQQVARALLDRNTHTVSSVAVSRDGSIFVSGSSDGTVTVWDAHGGGRHGDKDEDENYDSESEEGPTMLQELRVLEGHTNTVLSVDISADGRRIASTGWDRTVRVWNIEDGTTAFSPIECSDPEAPVRFAVVRYSPDGRQLAASIDQIYIWKADTGQRVRTIEDSVVSLRWTPDGKKLVGGGNTEIIIFDAVRGHRLHSFQLKVPKNWVRVLELSPTGSLAIASTRWNKAVLVVDLKNGKEVAKIPHEGNVFCAAWSPSGEFVVAGTGGKEMYVWPAPPEPATEESTRSIDEASLDASFDLDLPATVAPGQAPQGEILEEIGGLDSLIGLSAAPRPPQTAEPAARDTQLRSRPYTGRLWNYFRRSQVPTNDSAGIELHKRSHWPKMTRVAYAQARSVSIPYVSVTNADAMDTPKVWATARKTPPRQNLPMELSDDEASVTGKQSQQAPGVSGADPVASPNGQGNEAGASASTPLPKSVSVVASEPAPHASASTPGNNVRIEAEAQSIGSDDSNEADCCWCCCICFRKGWR
ncbi:hypothetical protein HYDPIDRAFT_42767 [Hydnomerulius pinastri MD-312]|uniref:WD40 repeat-like protein n=1 Tax=Hydnomerulius pinastri MD-312 TaxID=994086 RepID=A0A0C9W497_9AGAM|nr:hypothetical protein HYDPIDRAFT_42767 [Hydnomerulius pinastri MD-312]